jgi:multiple sugar transport system permease protein
MHKLSPTFLVSLIVVTLIVVFPFLWLLMLSFKTDDDIFAFPPTLFFRPTFEHYAGLWSGEFVGAFVNSLVTSSATTVVAMALGVPAAYGLSRLPARTQRRLGLAILVTRMLPPIAFTIPFFLAYRHSGLLDTRLGLVIVYLTFSLSLVIWMMQGFFAMTPRELEEAAEIDGATHWQTFRIVLVPLVAPGIAATSILSFLFAWNDFFFALILTRTEARTAPVAVVNFMNYEGWDWGKIAAGGTMVMAPVILFALAVRSYLMRGLMSGAVKG